MPSYFQLYILLLPRWANLIYSSSKGQRSKVGKVVRI